MEMTCLNILIIIVFMITIIFSTIILPFDQFNWVRKYNGEQQIVNGYTWQWLLSKITPMFVIYKNFIYQALCK